VAQLVKEYPNPQQCAEEWQPPEKEKPQRFFTTETVAFGARVEEARVALGWSKDELASKIFKKDGENIASSTINGVERGHQNCSLHIREQLENILGMKEGVMCLEA
jgi:ribosome-binding protein aMBF1 (putative translation factor)